MTVVKDELAADLQKDEVMLDESREKLKRFSNKRTQGR